MSNLRRLLTEQHLDGMLIGNLTNVRYLTAFTGSAGYLTVQLADATLYVDGRYTEQAQEQFEGGRVETTPRDILGGVLTSLRQGRGLSRLGFESRHLPHEQWRRVTDTLEGVELAPTLDLSERLRSRKDTVEIAAIRRAVEITDQAYADFLTWIKPGMSESEVAARCEYFQRSHGSDRKETRTAVGSGPRSSMPHCIAAERVIQPNEPVLLDIGCVVDGYTSDLTRTIFVGRTPPKEFQEIYRIVGEAQALAIAAIRPGVPGRSVHTLAKDYLAKHGFGDKFPHALGHSLGLNIHERPVFADWETATIELGNVITVEPGVYLPGCYGVRTEDLILVTESGCEVLNHADHALMLR
jgi:Xaa-Pro aminopeptidase